MDLSHYQYSVKGCFKGHTADVRVVTAARVPDGAFITGSRDTLVKLWVPGDGNEYKDEHVFIGATKFVASLCALPVSTQYPDGLILAGSNDSAIYGFTLNSQFPVMKLLGHSNVVCSLSAGFGLFVSGSWDGTARVWSGQNCTAILEGHESTVWATEVYPLQNIIITGSADHTIRIWRDGNCEKVLYGHEDCVRGLVVIQDMNMNFLSCSNDNTVRLWNILGECLNIYVGHDNYIYDITLLRNGVDFATCGEDQHVKIWQNGICVQSIKIASNTLWNITCLKNGDLAVACSDGNVRILKNTVSENGYLFGDYKKESSYICIYEWDNSKEKWILNQTEPHISDTEFDANKLELDISARPKKVKDLEFYLDIENKLCKLVYNRNDDPYMVTLDFMAEYDVDALHVTNILNYVLKNWIGFSKVSHLECRLPPNSNDYYPLDKYYTYMNANIAGIKKKLFEFTHCVPKEQHVPEENIEKLILVTDFPEEVSEEQMQVLDTILTWSDEYLYPALDLLRLAVKCKAVGSKVGNQSFMNHSLHVLRTTEKSINHVLLIKVLCNLFDFPEGEELMLKYQLKICDIVKDILLLSEKTHKSISSLYLNYAIAAHKSLTLDIDSLCLNLIEILKNVVDSDSLHKGFIAIGTLSIAKYAAFAHFHSLNVRQYLLDCKKHLKGDHTIVLFGNLLESFPSN